MAEMTHAHAEAAKNTKNVAVDRNNFAVPGFKVATASSGMRYRNRPDLALIVADGGQRGATGAGVFTTNRFCAAPVLLCRERLQAKERFNAVLINSGIANACTGDEGLERAREAARITAEGLDIPPDGVLVASTGIIGQQITLEPVAQSMSELVDKLDSGTWEDAARAIMTTDTVPKLASVRTEIGGKLVTVGGIAKGSGMIAPDMATLLSFVATDVSIDRRALEHWVREGAGYSFNSITVDGDTSTNDTLLVLASGKAENPLIKDTVSNDSVRFGEALGAVLLDLARQMVIDGEGATKYIEVLVTGAHDVDNAKKIAFAIANSPLVKTAFFGEDANWGRIVCAAGRAGVPIEPRKVALFFDDVCVFRNGTPLEEEGVEEKASMVLKQKGICVRLDLGMGESRFCAYTCDFTYDYVKINGSYRS